MSTAVILVAFGALLLVIYRWRTRSIVSQVPGPKPKSFLLGNMPELLQSQAAEADFKWQAQFGDVIKLCAPFGETRLLISDPKAIQYIFELSGYNFPKPAERRELATFTTGRGILWAEGPHHQRHRRVMKPAFATQETKAYLPLFSKFAAKVRVTAKWTDIITQSLDDAVAIDVPLWLSRATLDTIGETAFDYEFGTLDNAGNELAVSYFNLLAGAFAAPTDAMILLLSLFKYIPGWLLQKLRKSSPKLQHLETAQTVAIRVAKALLETKEHALAIGAGRPDLMSLLVKSNASENSETCLSEDEVISQMRTIMLAGHQTSASTLSWTLLELARAPYVQTKLRAEIRAAERAVAARGGTEFTPADLEGMAYLAAVLKEGLRIHPVAYNLDRVAGRDDVLPLSKPVTTTSGQQIYALPIAKDQWLTISVAAYNRNADVFGAEPHVFRPERWLDGSMPKRDASVGVYGNLMTFSGGVQGCIGWRFALLELQAFIVELVGNFEFALTPDAPRIRREAAMLMVPTLEGEGDKGAQLPLLVRSASRE